MAQESAFFSVNKLVALRDAGSLQTRLNAMPGVTGVRISPAESQVSVTFERLGVTPAQIQRKMELLGYPVEQSWQGRPF